MARTLPHTQHEGRRGNSVRRASGQRGRGRTSPGSLERRHIPLPTPTLAPALDPVKTFSLPRACTGLWATSMTYIVQSCETYIATHTPRTFHTPHTWHAHCHTQREGATPCAGPAVKEGAAGQAGSLERRTPLEGLASSTPTRRADHLSFGNHLDTFTSLRCIGQCF